MPKYQLISFVSWVSVIALTLPKDPPLCMAQRMAPSQSASEYRIIIKKQERRLYVYRVVGTAEKLEKTLKIALGGQPTGRKAKQGDGATPEGEYYITHRNPASKFFLSLGLSYPNADDAERGLKAGLLTRTQYQAIISAIQSLAKPPQNTRLGGDIFIHGGGTSTDWTAGCIALENADIEALFKELPLKTLVNILP